jgi:hypothetical protein
MIIKCLIEMKMEMEMNELEKVPWKPARYSVIIIIY